MAICYSILCDEAYSRRGNAMSWSYHQGMQVLDCVAAVVGDNRSFHVSHLKKELCCIALQFFSFAGSPLYQKFKDVEYEQLRLECTNSRIAKGNNLYDRSMNSVFDEVNQSSQDDLLHMFSLTAKHNSTSQESLSVAISKVIFQWVTNEAVKAKETKSSVQTSAAIILMMVELGSSCLAEFQEDDAAKSLVINHALDGFATCCRQRVFNASPDHSIQVDTSLVQRLNDRGYSWNAARRAVMMTNNRGYSEALSWAVSHFQDADFDSPIYFLHSDTSVYLDQKLIETTDKLLQQVKENFKETSNRASMKKEATRKPSNATSLTKISKIPSPSQSSSRKSPLSSTYLKKPFVSKLPIPSTRVSPTSLKVRDERSAELAPIETPTSIAEQSQPLHSGDSIDGSLGSRASIKKQIQQGKAKLGTQKLSLEERKKLAIEGKRLLDAARAKSKKVIAPPTTITTSGPAPDMQRLR